MNHKSNIVALSGTHCVGKSTLRDNVQARLGDVCNVLSSDSNSTDLKKLKDVSQDSLQVLIAAREAVVLLDLLNSEKHDKINVILKDRCILDTLIYSQYFYMQNLISRETLTQVDSIAKSLYRYYKGIFILQTVETIPFVDRDKFTMDSVSRLKINDLFLQFYKDNKTILPLYLISEESYKAREDSVYTDIISMFNITT